jgi:hypothetical protein
MTLRHLLSFHWIMALCGICLLPVQAQPATGRPAGISDAEAASLAEELNDLERALGSMLNKGSTRNQLADADVFWKTTMWAFKYETAFSPADLAITHTALKRGLDRARALAGGRVPWNEKRGKLVRGYVSKVDGSVQPYGLIIPSGYDRAKPMRLDVVLHGSVHPAGLTSLKFLASFDEGDSGGTAPDNPYIELHPLGRVENCYRWAGESDVFEAIEDACRHYNIDRDRIVLRGMSMGASGTWHLGLKHPDSFVALGPYCGYVDTHRFSETPGMNFVKVGPLPEIQERMLHMLDSVDYAANAGIVPEIAAIGDKDPFFQAHVIMREAMRREGLEMVNLISPGTAHVQDPATWAEQMRRIAVYANKGEDRLPKHIRFVTWTLKYAHCHWLELLKLKKHYDRSEIDATIAANGDVVIKEPINITEFAISSAALQSHSAKIIIGGQPVQIPKSLWDALAAKALLPTHGLTLSNDCGTNGTDGKHGTDNKAISPSHLITPSPHQLNTPSPAHLITPSAPAIVLEKRGQRWLYAGRRDTMKLRGKRPGLQGPIDDAFTGKFLCVRGVGKPWNPAIQAWAEANLKRFEYEWSRYFVGDLPIKDDTAVTPEDCRKCNLILFGDPGSNMWIRKALPSLPLRWTKDSVELGADRYNAADAAPAMICPSPFATSGLSAHYVVLNSGHTFHEAELNRLNYLLFPRLGDWAVFKVSADQPTDVSAELKESLLSSGFLNEDWKFSR